MLLPVVSQSPDENKVIDILSRKAFMNNAVSGILLCWKIPLINVSGFFRF